MPMFAEDIRYFKDVVILYVFRLRQRLIEASLLEQPIDNIMVTLHLATETQEGLIIDVVCLQSQQEYFEAFKKITHLVGMPIDIKFERFAYPLCDHAPFLRRSVAHKNGRHFIAHHRHIVFQIRVKFIDIEECLEYLTAHRRVMLYASQTVTQFFDA